MILQKNKLFRWIEIIEGGEKYLKNTQHNPRGKK